MSILIPKTKCDDKLFNRRLLAYYGLLFTVYWSHLILLVYVVLAFKHGQADAVIIAAFLGVPGTLAGIGFWKYLQASEKSDEVKIDSVGSSDNLNDTASLESRQSE